MISVPRERALQLISLLAGVASAAHWLADNSEDCGDEGIDCQRVDFEALSDALDKCEELPELPDSVYVRDGWLRAADELRALLAQPAEQHQGEPIGYVCPRALDAAINGRVGAEQISILKTPYLYINKPLYTHPAPAGSGEVERLRKATALVQRMLDCAGTQPSVATGYLRDILNVLRGKVTPSSPVVRDERAEFEACIRREWPMAPISRKRDLLPKDDPCYGDYCDEPLQRAWIGWQMRASLERKP
ncbi:hypothetical protein [Pseudomonas mosselii]|uniref:hypothetical protein n=1 Tax=Pseudomonas mosselii TaxID=78327 RepID=UPI003F367444